MKLEDTDLKAIAAEILQVLQPLITNAKPKNTEDIVFDIIGLSKYLSVSSKWIYQRTHAKEIPHIKIGGMLRFRKSEIDKWISSHNIPAVGNSKV
jgi:excisionase family DNA binding protein